MSLNVSRRQFLSATAMLAAGSALAACAPKATPAPAVEEAPKAEAPAAEPNQPAAEDKPVVKYSVFWNQLANVYPLWVETDEWKAMEETITIEFKTGAGGDAGRTAVAAGTPPDVGDLGPQRDFMIGGKLLPLEDYVAASSAISPDLFFEPNWEGGMYEGTLYGVPAHECFVRRGLNYNAAMVEEAGLDPDSPPQTWAEVFAWHEQLTKFDDGGNLIQYGIDPFDAEGGTGPGMDGFFTAESWDLAWFDAETGEFDLGSEKMAEALDTMGEFYRHMGVDNLQGVRSVEGQGTWGGAFNSGVQAMIVEGYWHPGETANEKPEISKVNRATWAPVPEFRKGDKIQFFGGHVSSLFAEGENVDAAWPILEFLMTDAACDPIFANIGWLPALKSYIEKADGSKFAGLQFYLDSASEATHKYGSQFCPIQSFVQTKVLEYRERVYRDELSAKDAVAALQDDVVNEWEEAGFAG